MTNRKPLYFDPIGDGFEQINVESDSISACGLVFKNTDNFITLDNSGNIVFKDEVVGQKTLTELAGLGLSSNLESLSIELQYDYINRNFYTELTYDVNNKISAVYNYVDDSKTVQLFNKSFTYDINGRCSEIVITRASDGASLTKSMIYDGLGFLTSTSRVYAT
jgi:hypothetical protein